MFRRIYIDFVMNRIKQGDLRWLASRAKQYLLIQASALAGRPLCGPVLGTLVTNYDCNYRCVMCDLPLRDMEMQNQGHKKLDTDGMRRVILDFRKLGVSGIGFTGGEPLLRSDITELLAYTKSLGMITHLNTNGSMLDEKRAAALVSAGVDSINISLDGASPDIHDRIRGVPGAFEKAVRAVQIICSLRDRAGAAVRVKTVSVLQEDNIDEVPALVSLAKCLRVDCMEFIPRQGFRSGSEISALPSAEFLIKTDKAAKYLLEAAGNEIVVENSEAHIKLFSGTFRNEPSSVKCFAGYNSLAVDCYGEIYPCVPWYNWRRSVGNIRNRDLADFWYSDEYNRMRKEISACRKCTLNCQAELNLLFSPLLSRSRLTNR